MSLKILILISFIQVVVTNPTFSQFDIQGHRGCRGLMPENTIPAFLKAIELGVTTLELDVVITADNQVLVSHDPFMSHEICRTPSGQEISEKDEKAYAIYRMNASQAMVFDCGTKIHSRFEQQEKIKIGKPLLSDVIDSVEAYVAAHNLEPVYYNIETKCTAEGDGIYHPEPAKFVDLLLGVVKLKNLESRVFIQSFDVRTLQYLKQINAPVKLVLLVENLKGISYNLDALGFIPDVYSPYYKLINGNSVQKLHQMGMKVIPWTVNEVDEMKSLINIKVDGIITDYPDRLIDLLKDK